MSLFCSIFQPQTNRCTVLFGVLVLHWATSFDSNSEASSPDTKRPAPSPGFVSQSPSTAPDFDSVVLNQIDFQPDAKVPKISDHTAKAQDVDLESGDVDIEACKRRDSQTVDLEADSKASQM